MTSDLKQIYHEKYDEFEYNSEDNKLIDQDNLDMPTGWSFICLDETINYYTEHISKDSIKH